MRDTMQSFVAQKQAALTCFLNAQGLNPQQQEAVRTVKGPVIVLAGAGSGKTTAIVSRIAFMMRFGDAYYGEVPPCSEEQLPLLQQIAAGKEKPEAQTLAEMLGYAPIPGTRILAITFTNKAANELKNRLSLMLGDAAEDVWAATFHSACVRILRRYIDRLGYRSDFTIYDADDSRRLIASCLGDPTLNNRGSMTQLEKTFQPKAVAAAISRAKDRLLTPDQYYEEADGDFYQTMIARIYGVYQHRLQEANAVDFDDIIMLTVNLFRQNPDVLEKYQNRCRYLLVDEYQDTNPAQYALIHLLAEKHHNLCVVGDDDQSIYKFRGATIENILSFEEQFPECKVIRLEQNYRSTERILEAANSIIRHNVGRKSKKLWTAGEKGEPIGHYQARDQQDEALFITEQIAQGVKNGDCYRDYAVLYRNHALSNALEQRLAAAGIPYRVFGGLRFYDRKEIRDVIAYLSVLNNPYDFLRFSRIINEPKRGIGAQTVTCIGDIANDLRISLLEVLETADSYPRLGRRASALREAGALFSELRELAEQLPPDELYDAVLEKSGYLAMLQAEGPEGEGRIENIRELQSNIREYMDRVENEGEEATLNGFLEEISLYTDQDRADESDDAVTLLTVHAAKGLEFTNVFLLGMEEGVFPSRRSMDFEEEIEEERRLAYVAVTRAKKRLYITNTAFRMLYGTTSANRPSRFLREIDSTLLHECGRMVQPAPKFERSSRAEIPIKTKSTAGDAVRQFSAGETVRHALYGAGTVLSVVDLAGIPMLEVAFEKVGTKKILAKTARKVTT